MEESYKNLEVSLQLQRGSSYLFLETGSSQVNLEVPPGSDHTVIRWIGWRDQVWKFPTLTVTHSPRTPSLNKQWESLSSSLGMIRSTINPHLDYRFVLGGKVWQMWPFVPELAFSDIPVLLFLPETGLRFYYCMQWSGSQRCCFLGQLQKLPCRSLQRRWGPSGGCCSTVLSVYPQNLVSWTGAK